MIKGSFNINEPFKYDNVKCIQFCTDVMYVTYFEVWTYQGLISISKNLGKHTTIAPTAAGTT